MASVMRCEEIYLLIRMVGGSGSGFEVEELIV